MDSLCNQVLVLKLTWLIPVQELMLQLMATQILEIWGLAHNLSLIILLFHFHYNLNYMQSERGQGMLAAASDSSGRSKDKLDQKVIIFISTDQQVYVCIVHMHNLVLFPFCFDS